MMTHKTNNQPTKLIDVEWLMGKAGRITPRAIFEPIIVQGNTFSNGPLFSWDYINKLGIQLNDDIIPYSIRNFTPIEYKFHKRNPDSTPILKLTHCFSCNTELATKVNKRTKSILSYCPNELDCPAQVSVRLQNYVSEKGLDIKSLSPRIVRYLFDFGYVKTFKDLHMLKVEDFEWVPQCTLNRAYHIVHGLAHPRNLDLGSILYAISIQEIGVGKAHRLANAFKTIDAFLNADDFDLEDIDTISEGTVEAIRNGLTHDRLEILHYLNETHNLRGTKQ